MSTSETNKTKIKQRIESLERQSKEVREELRGEIEITKEKLLDIGKIALGIGGGVLLSTLLLKRLGGKRKDKGIKRKKDSKRVYQRFLNQLASELSFQATMFLLGVIKDKLNSETAGENKAEDDDFKITE